MTNDVATIEALARPARQTYQVIDPIPVLDTARFEHMQRVANIMAKSNLIPESLSCIVEGTGRERTVARLADDQVMANCFLAVNQAVRWGMDPFAVAQCVSVVHGKLCYEGKLIAAVIEAKLGIRLKYTWNDKPGDQLAIVVSGKYPDEDDARTVEGTVAAWKTTGSNSPWVNQPRKQLAYRGAREWGRLHCPGIMLGVYSDDEMEDLSHSSRSSRATDVTPAPQQRRAPSPTAAPMIEACPAEPAPPAEPQPTPAAAQPTRRAPSPSAAPQPQPKPADAIQELPKAAEPTKQSIGYDPEKIRRQFVEAVAKAMDIDQLNDAWNGIIDLIWEDALKPDRDDWDAIFKGRWAELRDGREP